MKHKKRVDTGKAGGGPRNIELEGGPEGEIGAFSWWVVCFEQQ